MDEYIYKEEVAELLQVHAKSIDGKIRKNGFPKGEFNGNGQKRWTRSEVLHWIRYNPRTDNEVQDAEIKIMASELNPLLSLMGVVEDAIAKEEIKCPVIREKIQRLFRRYDAAREREAARFVGTINGTK